MAFIALIGLLFLVNKGNISNALEKTNAKNLFSRSGKEKTKQSAEEEIAEKLEKIKSGINEIKETAKNKESYAKPGSDSSEEEVLEQKGKIKKETAESIKSGQKEAGNRLKKDKSRKAENSPVTRTEIGAESGSSERKSAASSSKSGTQQMREAVIYFVTIDGDGKITRTKTARTIEKSDSPMSDAINALLAGPNIKESQKGMRSLIPADTKLLSAYVKDGIATINLSEEFMFNRYGIEGYTTQLAQIVFTASVFPTVNSVRFLIEGQSKEYLGAEGVWIGSPLSTDSF